ncbi:MAG: efflux transporter outer membrane subunit [Rhizobiales bacterium]|nr:efflux transporter outer membrane subunit [Hyphomicrobiales bacterium]
MLLGRRGVVVGRSRRFGSQLVAAMLLSGCAVGPNFETPAGPGVTSFLPGRNADPAGADRVPGYKLERGGEIPPQWWELFRSAKLDQLVQDGIAHNPDLSAAEAAVRVARANALAQRGTLFPLVSVSLDATRQRIPVETVIDPDTGEATTGPSRYSVVTRQVSVSFVPDVWGGTRRQIESADAEAESQAFQREGVYLTLASNIALAAVEEARLRGQIAATNRIIALQLDLLRILRRQHEQGHIALPDVATQETAVAQARLLLPALERQLAQQRNLLAFLTGRFPSEARLPTFELASFRLPRKLPLSVPGDLVRQRPDIRTAEANLRAANAGIGAAIAERLPQITLSANAGKSWSNVPELSPGGVFWSIGNNVAHKLFDAGTLAHKQRAAEEATNQSVAQYRSAVLAAFQSVADVLRALQSDVRMIEAAATARRSAQQNVDLVRRQVEQGQVDIPLLIEAQRAYMDTSLAYVDAQASRIADTVALFQALGGGWWNRAELAAGRTQRTL